MMHRTIRDVIDRYREAGVDESDRRDLVSDLGLFLHTEVAPFFVEILSAAEDGWPLIEALKMLEIYKINEEATYLAVGEGIRCLVGNAKSALTKIYAVKAACNFTAIPLMFPTILIVLFDQQAPFDARSSAFEFIRRTGNSENCRLVLTQLLQDPEFAQDAADLLRQWGVV